MRFLHVVSYELIKATPHRAISACEVAGTQQPVPHRAISACGFVRTQQAAPHRAILACDSARTQQAHRHHLFILKKLQLLHSNNYLSSIFPASLCFLTQLSEISLPENLLISDGVIFQLLLSVFNS